MSSIHLLVLVHGMWGVPQHLAELDRIIRETKSEPSQDGTLLHVLMASANSEDATYDGIDWGAERVYNEISESIQSLEKKGNTVTKFSITGYSLGGLISRYVVGILYKRGFFDNVTPINFNTIATPHIGLIKYRSLFSSLAHKLGPKLLSRTGQQFYCTDKFSNTGKPLLEVMADPNQVFYQGLALFKHLRIYANGVNDRTVPYVTAAIEVQDAFADYENSGIQVIFDDNYKPILQSYDLPSTPPEKDPNPLIFSPRWFQKQKERKPFLPPFLQFKFPLNIVLYAALPFLMPVLISMVLIRFTLATRSSQARIKLLEKNASNKEQLVHLLASIERQVENAVAELIDDPGPDEHNQTKKKRGKSSQPVIFPLQRKIAASLNKLPFKKEIAYFPDAVNSHAVIICRDVKRFAFHRQGEGVVRHWAEAFIL